jgi:hypothetical protein
VAVVLLCRDAEAVLQHNKLCRGATLSCRYISALSHRLHTSPGLQSQPLSSRSHIQQVWQQVHKDSRC